MATNVDLQIYGYTPGNYFGKCCNCKQSMVADKRATNCKTCALKFYTQKQKEYADEQAITQPEPIAYYKDIRGGEEEHY